MNQEPTEDNIIESKEEQNSDLHGYGDDVLSIEEINEYILERRNQGKSVKDVRDVYHSFRDYVDMRNHLVVALFNAYPELSWKSKKHHDEENDPIFNDTFITGMDTPEGPISYHLKLKFWDYLNVPEIDRAPEYDGYTEEDVKMRLNSLSQREGSRREIRATNDIENLKTYLNTLPLDREGYVEEYEYSNPVLTLADAVLSINRNYNDFVKPRIELIGKSEINSFADLEKELDKGNEHFMTLWNYKHVQRVELLRSLLNYFKDFQQTNNIEGDIETLREWGKQSSVEKFKDWNIKGIAFTTYQYLRMLCGADTVKPDRHILRIVEKGVGRKVNPKDSVKLIEDTSKEMGIEARRLDHAIWKYSSSKGRE